ncbi:hypothetical protein AC249_AIPGENE16712 [Exaiptasia diaphana]|nr:hypothetical protein AC249_AIPGENE16712 [Exaiptasia diaphana]
MEEENSAPQVAAAEDEEPEATLHHGIPVLSQKTALGEVTKGGKAVVVPNHSTPVLLGQLDYQNGVTYVARS